MNEFLHPTRGHGHPGPPAGRAAERDAEVLADRARLAEEAARAAEDAHAAATAALEELQGRG